MPSRKTRFRSVKVSLNDLLGRAPLKALCAARATLTGEDRKSLAALAGERVELYPAAMHERAVACLPRIGREIGRAAEGTAAGAASDGFRAASRSAPAPLAAWGYYRIGEDGVLHAITKAEHYHAALGHGFPGYRLLENARRLGIPNATHNNTRGHVTRTLEEELVRIANGLAPGDRAGLDKVLASKGATVLNRVLNLQSGSLAAEAALKLLLSRFWRAQSDSPEPKYAGKTPVFVVIADDDGGLGGNYHGTTVTAQMLRGMWPGMQAKCEEAGLLAVRSVRPNRTADLDAAFARYSRGQFRIAGFIHEIVLMNYGSRLLTPAFLKRAYALCRKHDVFTVVDEIQSCIWSPEIFMYREYGLKPHIVVLGKGMSGGEYAASRLLLSAAVDVLPQFGALVTNGQEEIASLAYLVSLRWAEANAAVTGAVGEYYETRMKELAARHPETLRAADGRRHLMALIFNEVAPAQATARALNARGLDISVQTYKADCPPAALTKLPITFGYEAVDAVIERMEAVLGGG